MAGPPFGGSATRPLSPPEGRMGYSVPVNGNRMVYGGYLMRSNLEVNLAIALDAHRVTWQYEAETIELPDGRRYVPDFTITEDPLNVVDGGAARRLSGWAAPRMR